MAAFSNPQVPSKMKTFVPLENNPEVMSHLVHQLGISPKVGFYDVYSIDDPELLAFIPRPAYALLFICPLKFTGKLAMRRIPRGSDLDNLLKEAIPLKPMPRADLLYESQALESAHQSAANNGDTGPPEIVNVHFICFVKGEDGHLWELNGGMKGPVDRGALDSDEDPLCEKALQLGVRNFLARKVQAGDGDLRFSIVALAPNFDWKVAVDDCLTANNSIYLLRRSWHKLLGQY
ncbi:MAG: hypothetical protein M1830_004673 [Pleopsidium flavum]|nr:MAG: hypothetical protein M1830_004673 [Pleopsidium flavum]